MKDKINQVLAWIGLLKILGCLHVGEKKDNPHCHFVIELREELQKQSFDSRIKKIFNVSGTQYSSKVWDGDDGACGYMLHESDDSIFCNKGFTDEDIEKFRQINKSAQKVKAINKEKASHKFIDIAMDRFSKDKANKWELLELFLKLVREGQIYYPGEFRMKNMIEEVHLKMLDEADMSRETQKIYERIFRNE